MTVQVYKLINLPGVILIRVHSSVLLSYSMDNIDDSELWMSGEEDEDEASTGDPTFFKLELSREGQSGGKCDRPCPHAFAIGSTLG